MKRAWQDDQALADDIAEAMRVAESFDFDEDFFSKNFIEDHEGTLNEREVTDDDDDDNEDDEDQEMTAEYVKKHFDQLYVQKVTGWIEDGKNVLVTGSPGRGKSTCVKKLISQLYRKGVRLVVTGSTGTAAANLGDIALSELSRAVENDIFPIEMTAILAPCTVHSAFGLKREEIVWLDECRKNGGKVQSIMAKYVPRTLKRRDLFVKKRRSTSIWGVPAIAFADALIIDEVSMIDGLLVELLDELGRFWWPERSGRPFGGLLVVFVGDFQQLPAVGSGTRQNPIYLFENEKWTTTTSRGGWIDRVLHLKTNIRQEGDLEYGKLLDRMTMNRLSPEDVELLQKCVLKPANGCSGLEAALNPYVMPFVPRVFNSRELIARYTQSVLREIDPTKKVTLTARHEYEPTKEEIYLAYGRQKVQERVKAFVQKNSTIADTELFIGCPVRFLENKDLEEGVVNGAIGKLRGITERGGHPIIELRNGKQYTLARSAESIYLDDYSTRERLNIERGRLRPSRDRPVAKFTYRHYKLKMALAGTPHAMQGYTLDSAIIHPNVAFDNEHTTVECLLVALSRLRSSGIETSGKAKTIRAIPQPTIHFESSDDESQPSGLYLTRFAIYPFFVRPKVRQYIDNIRTHHSPLGKDGKITG